MGRIKEVEGNEEKEIGQNILKNMKMKEENDSREFKNKEKK